MQSFKQYLKEDSITPGSVSFKITISAGDEPGGSTLYDIHVAIKNAFSENLDISVAKEMHNEIVITFSDLIAEYATDKFLLKMFRVATHLAESELKMRYNTISSDIESVLICEGFPPFKLEWNQIRLIFSKRDQKITGIDKLIGMNNTITIHQCENIIGGVLSLLKIKHGTLVMFWNKTPMPKWITIVHKHFKDKNIIACQKELYDNDLDDYAQL
jgi:hypothetical protein